MAVTRFKETERSSSSIYTTMAPIDPPMSFNDFLKDDENIVDKVRLCAFNLYMLC